MNAVCIMHLLLFEMLLFLYSGQGKNRKIRVLEYL